MSEPRWHGCGRRWLSSASPPLLRGSRSWLTGASARVWRPLPWHSGRRCSDQPFVGTSAAVSLSVAVATGPMADSPATRPHSSSLSARLPSPWLSPLVDDVPARRPGGMRRFGCLQRPLLPGPLRSVVRAQELGGRWGSPDRAPRAGLRSLRAWPRTSLCRCSRTTTARSPAGGGR
jgi:hypothetical protein